MNQLIVSRFPLLFAPPFKNTTKQQTNQFQRIPFSELVRDARQNNIGGVIVRPKESSIYYTDTSGNYNKTSYVDSNVLWRILLDSDADIDVDMDTASLGAGDVVSLLFSFVVFVSLTRIVFEQFARPGGGPIPFMQKKNVDVETELTTRFSDVQGIDEARDELEEIVDFLKHPQKYELSGARIPNGALLVGSPGTGKTLLARAIAGESSVPFIQVSASSFVEMFVGLGARRVRDIFETAKKLQPCIVFIDEIDAIGKKRSMNGFGANDEREQTINQLLTEMDGFSQSQIVVIGATNRADILDEALLRPGRFDRKIHVKLPDICGRKKILEVHSKDKKLSPDVSLKNVARQTIGFSGADLENLMNECAIRAARETEDFVITDDIIESTYQRIVVGAKGNVVMSLETRRRVAYHEAGHAIVGALMKGYEKVRKVSIVPRGDAGGITFFQPDKDEVKMMTKDYMLSQIKVALGGHAAEELVYGKDHVSTGATSDFSKVYEVTREMVVSYGFSEAVGKLNVKGHNLSQDTMYYLEKEMMDIVSSCYNETLQLLTTRRKKLDSLADKLLDDEIIDGEFVYYLVADSYIL